MANIGGFAGGLASGFMAGEQLKLQKAASAREEARNAREDTEFKFQQSERERQTKMRDEVRSAIDQAYAPMEVEEPFESVNSEGQKVQGTRKKMVPPDTNSPAFHLGLATKVFGIRAQHTSSPEDIAQAYNYVQKATQTEDGRLIASALLGNQGDLDKLTTKFGGDPSKARIIPASGNKGMMFDFANGKPPVDIGTFAAVMGAAGGYTPPSAISAASDKAVDQTLTREQIAATTEEKRGNTAKDKAYVEQVVPATVEQLRASRNLSNAQANLAGAKAGALKSGSLVDAKASKEIEAAAARAASKIKDPLMQADPDALPQIQRIGTSLHAKSKGSISPQSAANAGAERYMKISAETRAWAAKQPKGWYKGLGFETPDDAIRDATSRRIEKEYPRVGVDNVED